MPKQDISTALTHHLSTILEDCRRIEPALQAYLKASDERPNINFELLRILSNALPRAAPQSGLFQSGPRLNLAV